MFDIIGVGLIVGTAFFLAGRSLYRLVTGKDTGCGGCGKKSSCSGGGVSIMDKMED